MSARMGRDIMAEAFTDDEWRRIAAHLEANPASYGLPERREGSVVLLSWNIRKFGAFLRDGVPTKSPGAFAMIERVCQRADLIALQEVQSDTESLYALRDRLRGDGAPYDLVLSDVTGRAPGYTGMAERMAFLYRSDRVERGDLASDLSFDRSAVVENVNAALATVVNQKIALDGQRGFWAGVLSWLGGKSRLTARAFGGFVQFIRAPHIVEFHIQGEGGAYRFYCVNAHLVSGSSKAEREMEFFALLEWLLLDSQNTLDQTDKSFVIMADLNLDFKSGLSERRAAFEAYITTINAEKRLRAKVNFPFLDGGFFTNARRDQTYDHIAWITNDTRLPRGRHNGLAGTLGPDQYDCGMFDFVQAFMDAGPGRSAQGGPAYDRFTHDFTDHMPIWLRLPRPHPGQADFTID